MSKTTIALGIIVMVCIVSAIYLLTYNQPPQGKPEFKIVNFDLQPAGGFMPHRISFKLQNIGSGDATLVYGTIRIGSWNRTWELPVEYVLEVGETTPWINTYRDLEPTEPTVIIIVKCSEGVTQQLTESLPP